MQEVRKYAWTRGKDDFETFDLNCAGVNCDKEFEMDITLWCRCAFAFDFLCMGPPL